MQIEKNVTLQQVKKSGSNTVYYSANTLWWTDDPEDLQRGPIPLDIYGSPLFQGELDIFLRKAQQKPDHYGSHGLTTLMAAHHKNMKPEKDDDPKLRTSWSALNRVVHQQAEASATGFQLLS